MATICELDGEILACAVYREDKGGYKMTHCECIQTQIGKECLQEIIKRDIASFKCGYWVEASGVIEHWFKKHDGYPILNVYVEFLIQKNVVLDSDGFHYTRMVGEKGESYKKIIFGFRDEEFYNEVISEFENYQEMRERENLTEDIHRDKYPKEIRNILLIASKIYDEFNEYILNEMTPRMEQRLLMMRDTLMKYEPQDRTIASSLKRINIMLNEMPRLVLHSINDLNIS